MAMATYYNAPNMTEPRVLGEFDVQGGAWFQYSERPADDRDGAFLGYPHRVFTCDGDRAALVLKTVAYVVIDEAPDGGPIHEKWELRRARTYA